MSGCVYFMRAGTDGPIKIGFTSGDPLVRLSNIQVACPWKLELIGHLPGSRTNELWLHDRMSAHRMMGEWFEATADVISEVSQVLSDDFAWPIGRETAIDRAIEFAGSQWELSNKIGVSQPLISHARRRGRAGPKLAIAIHKYTKGEISVAELRPDLWSSSASFERTVP